MGRLFASLALVFSLMAVLGCEQEGPAERAGEEIDQAAEEAGEAVDNAGEQLKQDAKDES